MLIELISLTLLVFMVVLVKYSLRRINRYESVILEIDKIIRYSSERLKVLDSSGHFETDDEIEFFFEEVKKLQSLLDNIFEPMGEHEETKEK
tara:strand:- start:292 stop:567 length:276 start_codon:yes stop_codon:yes gene_type:complete